MPWQFRLLLLGLATFEFMDAAMRIQLVPHGITEQAPIETNLFGLKRFDSIGWQLWPSESSYSFPPDLKLCAHTRKGRSPSEAACKCRVVESVV